MTVLALSAQGYITKYGGYAGIAAMVGVAVLALLYFAQAREMRRLRDWAGRAPERAAELAARAAEVERLRAQGAPVPRTTPLVTGNQMPPQVPQPHPQQQLPPQQPAGPAPQVSPPPDAPALPTTTGVTAVQPQQDAPTPAPGGAPAPAVNGTPPGDGATPSTPVTGTPAQPQVTPEQDTPVPAAAPAVPAIAAAAPAPASAQPAPMPPLAVPEVAPAIAASAPVAVAAGVATPPVATGNGSGAPVAIPRPSRPPAPPAPGQMRAPAGATRVPGPAPGRPSPAQPARGGSHRHGSLHLPAHGRRRQPLADIGGSKRRSPSRAVGASVAALAALIIVIVLLPAKSKTGVVNHVAAGSGSNATGAPANPATLAVAVINSTQTDGLARTLSGNLQRNGYRKATFLTAQPASELATSVVMYTAGHHADAQAVATVLGIGSVQAIDGPTRSLAGSATVVVVAGDDLSNAVATG
jgi:hypothetical protein